MNIALDLRFLQDNIYGDFVLQLVQNLASTTPKNTYIAYTNNSAIELKNSNIKIKKVGILTGSFDEQFKFHTILKKGNHDLVVFFTKNKPLWYKKKYLCFVPSLKDVYYQNFDNTFKKHVFLYGLEKNIKNANKILCFDHNTKNELIERFNIHGEKITEIPAFFPIQESVSTDTEINVNIKTKYNIKNDFLIYSGGNGIEKNTEKLIKVFSKLKKENINLDLVILGEEISKNVFLRNLTIENKLQHNIHFIGVIKDSETALFYQNSIGTIFPSLYEPFPFLLRQAIQFKQSILASNISNIQDILSDCAYYFSPISINSIHECIINFLNEKKKKKCMNTIFETYNINTTTQHLVEIINTYE